MGSGRIEVLVAVAGVIVVKIAGLVLIVWDQAKPKIINRRIMRAAIFLQEFRVQKPLLQLFPLSPPNFGQYLYKRKKNDIIFEIAESLTGAVLPGLLAEIASETLEIAQIADSTTQGSVGVTGTEANVTANLASVGESSTLSTVEVLDNNESENANLGNLGSDSDTIEAAGANPYTTPSSTSERSDKTKEGNSENVVNVPPSTSLFKKASLDHGKFAHITQSLGLKISVEELKNRTNSVEFQVKLN